MDPKDNKLVDEIYNSPDPTAAVKKLVKDTAPPDVNTSTKSIINFPSLFMFTPLPSPAWD